jgi:hypothetical protein
MNSALWDVISCNAVEVYLLLRSPRNFPIEDYNEVFYTIYERNIVSIQRKKRLGRSNSMGEVDLKSSLVLMFKCLHLAAI